VGHAGANFNAIALLQNRAFLNMGGTSSGIAINNSGANPTVFGTSSVEVARIQNGLQVGTTSRDASGVINAGVGFNIAGAATSGNVLRGNGTNFVSAQLACSDLSGAGSGCSSAAGITALTGDVTASGSGSVAATLTTAQPAAHTWALAQTFTVAPVFTDQSGSRTALGLGTAAIQNTGTSGGTVPLLNGTNTWSAVQTFSSGPAFNALPTGTAVASANTASTLVARDSSGNFSAGTIQAALTGHASLDLALTGGTMSGAIAMGTNAITGLTTLASAGAMTFQSNGSTFAGLIDTSQRWLMGNTATIPSTVTLMLNQNAGATVPTLPGSRNFNMLIAGTDTTQPNVGIMSFSGSGVFNYPAVTYLKARGSMATPTAVKSGDFIGANFAYAYNGSAYNTNGSGFVMIALEDQDTTHFGSGVDIYTTPTGGGSPGNAIAARFQGSTGLTVGGSSPDPGAGSGIFTGHLQIGSSTAATLSTGEFDLTKITASGTAPTAGNVKIAAVAGTNAGTCKIIAYAGTSTTPVVIVDNIGSGC
jgi:hypothetical protein